MMKAWVGRWLIGVAVIHTALSAVVFGGVFEAILRNGVFDAVRTDPTKGLAVWCVLFGGTLFICGLAVAALEQRTPQDGALPRSLGWALLALAIVGIVLMPASGFWLALPPALAVIAGKPKAQAADGTWPSPGSR